MSLSTYASAELPSATVGKLRRLMDAAYEGCFTDEDWENALGGTHVVIEDDAAVVAHGAVVPRKIVIGGSPVRAGYIEAIAVDPARQRAGMGADVMRALAGLLNDEFEIGILSTGIPGFYTRAGWERWRGPTFVHHPDGTLERTPEEDDGVLILRTSRTPTIDLHSDIVCDDRPGDAW